MIGNSRLFIILCCRFSSCNIFVVPVFLSLTGTLVSADEIKIVFVKAGKFHGNSREVCCEIAPETGFTCHSRRSQATEGCIHLPKFSVQLS